MTEEKIPFLDMFPDAAVYADSCGGLDKAEVSGVTIVRETMTMVIRAWMPQMPAPAELRQRGSVPAYVRGSVQPVRQLSPALQVTDALFHGDGLSGRKSGPSRPYGG